MYCINCGKKLNSEEKFCVNCGAKVDNQKINYNSIQNKLYSLLNSLSFINGFIMMFYTFSEDSGNLGVLVALMIGPILMLPQSVLMLLNNSKKHKLMINIILIIGGLFSTMITLSMVKYKFNIFIVLNILLLVVMFINLLINNKKVK